MLNEVQRYLAVACHLRQVDLVFSVLKSTNKSAWVRIEKYELRLRVLSERWHYPCTTGSGVHAVPVLQATQQAFDGMRQRAGIIQYEQPRAMTGNQLGSEPRIAREALLDIRQ